MWVVDTDYDEYALLCTSGTKGLGQDVHMASLYSTCPSGARAAAWREAWVGGGRAETAGLSSLPQAAPRAPGPK